MGSILVTGAAGFIGSAFLQLCEKSGKDFTIVDSMTYAGHLDNLKGDGFDFTSKLRRIDIRDSEAIFDLIREYSVEKVVNFAAESHVDNSISGPRIFMETNIMGTFSLLEAVRRIQVESDKKIRFLHVSTDEVFGELGETGKFSETTPYAPNSPYSASKAASDMLVRAWHETYGLDTVITNCSNNYGPRQFPEKLIPRIITNALKGLPLPVYGAGENIRDWIYVDDHAEGVMLALEKGKSGQSYCFGGNAEMKNIDVVKTICRVLDKKVPKSNGQPYANQIAFVEDRKGHDFRYAIDDTKSQKELGFKRRINSFEAGIDKTIQWYLDNSSWVKSVEEKPK